MSQTASFDDWDGIGTIDGFKLHRPIGQSISCVVFEALRLIDDKQLAVKVFVDKSNLNLARERFKREWQVSQRLSSKYRVEVFELLETSLGLPALCMQLIEGQTLKQPQQTGRIFEPNEVTSIMVQTAEYLMELHELGFVHGDIKPSNLMLTDSSLGGQIKVLDLGLSREINDRTRETSSPHKSDSQQLVAGSPTYMAPELVLAPMICNASSDLYALGCVAYELVAGSPPFVGNNALQILLKHRNETPASLSSFKVTSKLNRLIMACLEKNIQDRPSSASDLYQSLLAI